MGSAPFGVMLVNLGTPEAPTTSAVRRYLAEFLGDPRVIDLPRVKWLPILHGIILRIRPPRVAKAYASVWQDEGSPLLAIGRRQQRALKARLAARLGTDIPVELAMTYGKPSMEEAGLALRDAGVERILVLPLYPQYSATTTGAVFDRLARALSPCPHLPELRFVRDYHDHPAYIEALAESIREHWETHGRQPRLLFSYHGIPKRYAEAGDPYPRHCETTSRLVAEALGLEPEAWQQTYQSRFGREEWLKPYTDDTLKAWGVEGLEGVDVISPAFAADCLETLEELEVENRGYFTEAGGGDYRYIPALNDRAAHIDMLASLVEQHTQGW
ncbi:ferrochelatase [Chromohalobacter israelensis]|uniref:Ferrochelatase n=1 Tax=Chromohalobacter israelensis (strain ATCC BAA-138 / DSM 3043 / CIP 106854 / NCIMB 13768 / 1H11) TaxID=290398 RepID=Q1QZ54_CHRI1|nr:ferrochelatase [Chromohalobacter salexigens]ABE58254.1 Ferrochelatase [Chromohalobacter salexigens DSM 3043]